MAFVLDSVGAEMIARRIYWATMPYWGWVTFDDGAEGSEPCPWWAHPLCWLHSLTEWWLCTTHRSPWGPRFNANTYIVGEHLETKPWK